MHFKILKIWKKTVARKLAVRHTSFVCVTASFLATGGFIKIFHKVPWFFHDYSVVVFLNSMIFPCMELFSRFSRFSMISRARGNPVMCFKLASEQMIFSSRWEKCCLWYSRKGWEFSLKQLETGCMTLLTISIQLEASTQTYQGTLKIRMIQYTFWDHKL